MITLSFLSFGSNMAFAGPNDPVVGAPPPMSWLPLVNPNWGPWTGPGLGSNFGMNFFTGRLVPFAVSFVMFIVMAASVIFSIVGGIMWITSGGNKEGLAKAKNTVTYAILGLVLALGSFIALNIVGRFFGSNLLR